MSAPVQSAPGQYPPPSPQQYPPPSYTPTSSPPAQSYAPPPQYAPQPAYQQQAPPPQPQYAPPPPPRPVPWALIFGILEFVAILLAGIGAILYAVPYADEASGSTGCNGQCLAGYGEGAWILIGVGLILVAVVKLLSVLLAKKIAATPSTP